jgi:hypothetical protein
MGPQANLRVLAIAGRAGWEDNISRQERVECRRSDMKTIAIAAAALALCVTSAANAGMDEAEGGHGICLYPHEIDHTQYINPTTVLFHMKDGKVYMNTLKGPCPGLAFHGFTYLANDVDEVCSNAMPISVIESHEACSLGTFTRYTPPASYPPPPSNPG